MDIVVQLEDGSIANVECQKIGYAFQGQRAACYSGDLLLRQYKRVRGERGEKFLYKDIKKVYSIIFYEQSPKELDRNTVQFMIDEMQDEIDSQKVQIQEKDAEIDNQKAQLQEQDMKIAKLLEEIARLKDQGK